MKHKNNSRRQFIYKSILATGGLALASNFISCSDDDDVLPYENIPENLSQSHFDYGVASFDPTANQVIIWTRYTTNLPTIAIAWQVATDADFTTVVRSGEVTADSTHDYTVAIEVQDLTPATNYFYRFIQLEDETVSITGETKTFPENASEVKIAICSCSNYPAGLFNVYNAMANSDVDVIVHLGDYIYEYGENEYGTNENTSALNRVHQPTHEIVSLDDYRTRYKQYRSDADLQLAHQKKPFICVWDDHEIANDTYKDGAENHQSDEGSFTSRKAAAIKAYSEYIPVRTEDNDKIYRSFNIGNLINLIMLDTRVIGRDKQLSYSDYFTAEGTLDTVAFQTDLMNPERTMLGTEQRNWLLNELESNTASWQVIGQQVLMGKMMLPMELLLSMNQLLTEIEVTGSASAEAFASFTNLMQELLLLKARIMQGDPTLTEAEVARVTTVAPYNLDAWDGYPVEREILLNAFAGKKVVCLAGDTHNAWINNLRDTNETQIAKEYATTSVSSPGFEAYLGLAGNDAIQDFQQALQNLIVDLVYVNAWLRGFVTLTFTQNEAISEYIFIDTIANENYDTTTLVIDSYSGNA